MRISQCEGGRHELVIDNIALLDAGEYECVAENEAGEATCTISVSVKGLSCALQHHAFVVVVNSR